MPHSTAGCFRVAQNFDTKSDISPTAALRHPHSLGLRWTTLPLAIGCGWRFTNTPLGTTTDLMRPYMVRRYSKFQGCSCRVRFPSPRVVSPSGYMICPYYCTHALNIKMLVEIVGNFLAKSGMRYKSTGCNHRKKHQFSVCLVVLCTSTGLLPRCTLFLKAFADWEMGKDSQSITWQKVKSCTS